MIDLNLLDTEGINENSRKIDQLSTYEILETINDEDQKVATVIRENLGSIEAAVEAIFKKVKAGGRLIYIGAGTSGRLGVLDASECPPTYGVSKELVQGIIAGGVEALQNAIEGAEDVEEGAIEDLKSIHFSGKDALVGLAASGRTPYVRSAIIYANELGAVTASISCVKNAVISEVSQYPIEAVVGPEVITGSTRMKAGTAQKLILNMISTTVMVKLGKVYGNLMVDVKATNEKLKVRAKRIIEMTTDLKGEEAIALFKESGESVKVAILMEKTGLNREEAEVLLDLHEGKIRKAIENYESKARVK